MTKKRNNKKEIALIPYADYQWVEVHGNILTIGLSEDALDDFGDLRKADLPEEGSSVDTEEVFGEIETSDGPIQLYSPVKGTIVDVNSNVLESADIIIEDPQGEGWMVRIEAESKEEVNDFIDTHGKTAKDEDDDDEDDDEGLEGDEEFDDEGSEDADDED